MATFPTLKTGAVAQYPLKASSRYSTQVVEFLDGSRQTFKLFPTTLRRWKISLAGLDERELDALISFVEAQGDQPFSFPDPVSGTTVARCLIEGQILEAGVGLDMAGQATLSIEEIA